MRPRLNLHVLLSSRGTRVVAQLLFMDHAIQTNYANDVCATTPSMSALVVPPLFLCVVYVILMMSNIYNTFDVLFISVHIEFQ